MVCLKWNLKIRTTLSIYLPAHLNYVKLTGFYENGEIIFELSTIASVRFPVL